MELPCNWIECSINEIADVFLGKTPKRAHYRSDGCYKVIKFRDLKNGYIDFNNKKDGFVIDDFKIINSLRDLRKNDVLITSAAHSGENIGKKCSIVRELPPKYKEYFFTGELLNIRSSADKNLAKWIYYFFLSKEGLKEIQKAVAGVHLTSGRAQTLNIKIAPSEEQHRLVAKLEKLLAKIDKCKERLDKIPSILKRFRQSVLAAACSGELTRDWRNKEAGYNSVSEILERLKVPSPKRYLNVFHETSDIEIPSTWRWLPLGKLGKMIGGGTPDKSKSKYWIGSIPWVSPKDMKKDRIEGSIDHINEEALANSSAKLIPTSSILFVIRGMILNHSLPVAITERPITINQDMKAIVPHIPEMDEYIFIAAKYISKKILFAVKEATHGTRRIETQILQNWAVPIPPIDEQKIIISRTESLFQIADQIEERYNKAKSYIDKLTQAILAKAFRGELVSQDPNDEPASELLKRIKEEKEKTKPPKSKPGKTGASNQRRKKAV